MRMNISIDESTKAFLERLSQTTGLSYSEIVRRGIMMVSGSQSATHAYSPSKGDILDELRNTVKKIEATPIVEDKPPSLTPGLDSIVPPNSRPKGAEYRENGEYDEKTISLD